MGTSSSFDGADGGTPLLPTWDDGSVDRPNDDDHDTGTETPPRGDTEDLPTRPAIKPPPEPDRFGTSRGNFTRFVSSGGTDRRAFGRAISGHVRAVSGGAGNAARRLSTSRRTATGLLNVLQSIQESGAAQTLRGLSLDGMIGRPAKEVLISLTDIVCEAGGPIDEAIARKAFVETVLELEVDDLDTLAGEQIESIVLGFIGRSIAERIIMDICQQIDTSAMTAAQADYLRQYLDDFVVGAVRDGLGSDLANARAVQKTKLDRKMEKIYELAFSIIEAEASELAL